MTAGSKGNRPAGSLIVLTSDVIDAYRARRRIQSGHDGRLGSYWPCADSGLLTATGVACERYRLAVVKNHSAIRDRDRFAGGPMRQSSRR